MQVSPCFMPAPCPPAAERLSTHGPACSFSCTCLWDRTGLPSLPTIVPQPQLGTLILIPQKVLPYSPQGPEGHRRYGCLLLYTGGRVDNYHCWLPYAGGGLGSAQTVHSPCLTSSNNKVPSVAARRLLQNPPQSLSSDFISSVLVSFCCYNKLPQT